MHLSNDEKLSDKILKPNTSVVQYKLGKPQLHKMRLHCTFIIRFNFSNYVTKTTLLTEGKRHNTAYRYKDGRQRTSKKHNSRENNNTENIQEEGCILPVLVCWSWLVEAWADAWGLRTLEVQTERLVSEAKVAVPAGGREGTAKTETKIMI